ncbi:TorF family putative porin [Oceanicoccus sp. KOV_DT_Chl]|uniref:TorF family putative porin n=1 Tax=Oceanicoccus sp. KOV_DT_Chl TaxID=1904639 RepID=UPI000C79A1C1|nr:TorF family putative porin [Oceanicoccus sp. KOV_DT_Chl]
MKTIKTLLATAVAASTFAAPAVMAEVEVAASVAVASSYLWRGQDLGDGSPAVSGDLVASMGGLYGGIWGSSGDDTAGNEYDLFVGYGAEFGEVSVDLSVWNYVYPDGGVRDDNFGDLSEAILSVGFGPVSVTYYDNIAGGSGYTYLTVGAEFGAFSFTVGQTDNEDSDDDYTHFDIGYAYNDNVSFTFSQVVDEDDAGNVDDDLNFVVSYSLPIQ